jgi:uncharacterized protein (TIGR00645 family)
MAASHHTGDNNSGAQFDHDNHYGRGGPLYGTEMILERMIFASRWFLMPMFLGLAVALLMFSINFVVMIYHFALEIFHYDKDGLLVMMLTFVDKVLVGTLIIMVIISGYENSVGKLDVRGGKLSWLGKLDSSSLKIKLATSIVSISSIHLLKVFLDLKTYAKPLVDAAGVTLRNATGEVIDNMVVVEWTVIIHFIMVLTAIMLAAMDRVQGHH